MDVGGESALAMGKGAVWYDFRTLRRNDERGVYVHTVMQIMYMIGELALWSRATELLSFGTPVWYQFSTSFGHYYEMADVEQV